MQKYPPIVSLSLNPAIDLTYEIDNLTHDQKTRAKTSFFEPGGTGVNVGKALENLNANCHTCCITAGKIGHVFEQLLADHLNYFSVISAQGETRINTTIIQSHPHRQFEINQAGPYLSPLQTESTIQRFLSLCQHGFGVLTGSLPPSTPESLYSEIIDRLKQQGAKAIIDAPVSTLKKTLSSQPFLIKPNVYELEMLTQKTLRTTQEVALQARKLVNQGIDNVCVSLGEQGGLLSTSENTYFCQSPKIQVKSTVGAGDSMLAGLAYSYSQNLQPNQALQFAVACGAGTAKQPGTQLFNPLELEDLINLISIQTLDL